MLMVLIVVCLGLLCRYVQINIIKYSLGFLSGVLVYIISTTLSNKIGGNKNGTGNNCKD